MTTLNTYAVTISNQPFFAIVVFRGVDARDAERRCDEWLDAGAGDEWGARDAAAGDADEEASAYDSDGELREGWSYSVCPGSAREVETTRPDEDLIDSGGNG